MPPSPIYPPRRFPLGHLCRGHRRRCRTREVASTEQRGLGNVFYSVAERKGAGEYCADKVFGKQEFPYRGNDPCTEQAGGVFVSVLCDGHPDAEGLSRRWVAGPSDARGEGRCISRLRAGGIGVGVRDAWHLGAQSLVELRRINLAVPPLQRYQVIQTSPPAPYFLRSPSPFPRRYHS
jgi:hypothetical protein